MTKGVFGDSKASRQDLEALAKGEEAGRIRVELPVAKTTPSDRPDDWGHLGPDNEWSK